MNTSSSRVVPALVEDFRDEAQSLMAILESISAESWQAPTPAVGWRVHDQVAHLAHFDHLAGLCITRPAEFVELRDCVSDLQEYIDGIGAVNDWRDGPEMLSWWRGANHGFREAALSADPATRVPWFGPSMSLASKITARIMETWAHGQDIADTLGVSREATNRLSHVARIGVLALPNSFNTRGLPVPETSIRVDLTAPDGSTWSWGSGDAPESVTGPALDFCLVVTHRRHLADTELVAVGPVANQWLSIAQAFAGPPGEGRLPGQFAASNARETV